MSLRSQLYGDSRWKREKGIWKRALFGERSALTGDVHCRLSLSCPHPQRKVFRPLSEAPAPSASVPALSAKPPHPQRSACILSEAPAPWASVPALSAKLPHPRRQSLHPQRSARTLGVSPPSFLRHAFVVQNHDRRNPCRLERTLDRLAVADDHDVQVIDVDVLLRHAQYVFPRDRRDCLRIVLVVIHRQVVQIEAEDRTADPRQRAEAIRQTLDE